MNDRMDLVNRSVKCHFLCREKMGTLLDSTADDLAEATETLEKVKLAQTKIERFLEIEKVRGMCWREDHKK